MENMHGSGAALRPLRAATALTRLRLSSCHFESGERLGEALAGVVRPSEGGGAPGLAVLELDECGVQSAVVAGLITALGGVNPSSPAASPGTSGAAQEVEEAGGSATGKVASGAGRGGCQGEAPVLRELRVEFKWRA